MKILLAGAALAATIVSYPAFAEVGCEPGNSLNDVKVSDCDDKYGYGPMGSAVIAPTPYYDSGSFAYVPSRPLIRQRMRSERSLNEETRVKAGAAE